MTKIPPGGYFVKDIENFDSKYKCPICFRVLKDPLQLFCGHRMCQTCVQSQTEDLQCIVCGEISPISEVRLDKGFRKDMDTLQIICGFCDWTGQLKLYQTHLEQYHKQFTCSFCSEIFDSQILIQEHEENICPKKPVYCYLQQFGCKEQIFRGELGKHYLTADHHKSLLICLKEIIEKRSNMKNHMETETSSVTSRVPTRSSSITDPDEYQNELDEVLKVVDVFANAIHHLKDDLTHLSNEATQIHEKIEATEKMLSAIKTSDEISNNILNAMYTNLLVLREDLSILKTKFEEQQVTSYDGTLVWKITEVSTKMNDARSERQTSIYSPPFRSSPTGYLMRARLYLYGDGNARRTHMSLFFVLLRGPHDSILPFPFSFKVTFCLYDQTPAKNHIVESFRPDTKSNSFQRPRSDMNIASGIPKFVSLKTFEQPDNPYVKDDTMFIKVIVDFENMSKTILPFATKLNPGLPMHIQYKLIREEIEQRTLADTRTNSMSTNDKMETNKK